MIHQYLRTVKGEDLIASPVQPGYPHGDAWTAVMHPNDPPTHDVERYLILQAEKQKKKAKSKK